MVYYSFEKAKSDTHQLDTIASNTITREEKPISSMVDYSSSLVEMGNIIFAGSRDLLPDELDAMHKYLKKKYRKV